MLLALTRVAVAAADDEDTEGVDWKDLTPARAAHKAQLDAFLAETTEEERGDEQAT